MPNPRYWTTNSRRQPSTIFLKGLLQMCVWKRFANFNCFISSFHFSFAKSIFLYYFSCICLFMSLIWIFISLFKLPWTTYSGFSLRQWFMVNTLAILKRVRFMKDNCNIEESKVYERQKASDLLCQTILLQQVVFCMLS